MDSAFALHTLSWLKFSAARDVMAPCCEIVRCAQPRRGSSLAVKHLVLIAMNMRHEDDLMIGSTERVRLVEDPSRIGTLTGRVQMRRSDRMVQVAFGDGVRWIPDYNIERVPEVPLSPLDMLEDGNLGRPADLSRTLTHVKLSGRLANVIYSMEATNTDFYAYQFKPVIKLLESPTNRILIADEVGLGKTIEAGLIWTELRSRFDLRRLWVVCPAALREKWERELKKKFGIKAEICDAKRALAILSDEDTSTGDFAMISSTQSLRPPRGWEVGESDSGAARLARYLRKMESEERLVDLLVVDEAHHLRNAETRTNELGQLCTHVSEYAVFLTATPIHNRSDDLFSLLNMLDPDTFTRKEVLTQVLSANEPLVKARDLVLAGSPDVETLRTLLNTARSHPLLQDNRQLALIEESDLAAVDLSARDRRSRLAYRLETVNLLAHVVTRTRKRDVKELRVVREPVAEMVELTEVERNYYEMVTQIVREYALRYGANDRFLLAQPQRQMTSSMAASLRSWQRRGVDIDENDELDEPGYFRSSRERLGPLAMDIVRRARDFPWLDELLEHDSKYNRLRELIVPLIQENPNEKVVLFSTFRPTIEYLAERLEQDGIRCIELKGGQSETKDSVITRFSESSGPNVLLSTEVGGEGVDLQFSRVVINYDLPWNPMRIEQRIGRIDRLGQKSEKVTIWNILHKDTIDARIYERLYAKLDLCRTALGDFDAILGDEIRKMTADLLSFELTPEQQEKRIVQTAQALENLRHEEQQLEQDAANLIAYGDYILNQVQAARNLQRWVGGEEIRRYVFSHLRLEYAGCEIHQVPNQPNLFDLSLSEKAKFDLRDFITRNRLGFHTRLIAPQRTVRCRFESKSSAPTTTEELITHLHPLVRMVREQVESSRTQITPAVAATVKRDEAGLNLPGGVYLVAAASWSFRGLQDLQRVAYAAMPFDASSELLDSDVAEKLANAVANWGKDWLEARGTVDLVRAHELVNNELFGRLDDDYSAFIQDLRAKNDDRADIQLRTLDQHLFQQVEKIMETRDRMKAAGHHSIAKAHEGRIQALRNRVEHQKLKISNNREATSDKWEIAVSIVQLV